MLYSANIKKQVMMMIILSYMPTDLMSGLPFYQQNDSFSTMADDASDPRQYYNQLMVSIASWSALEFWNTSEDNFFLLALVSRSSSAAEFTKSLFCRQFETPVMIRKFVPAPIEINRIRIACLEIAAEYQSWTLSVCRFVHFFFSDLPGIRSIVNAQSPQLFHWVASLG